MNIIDLLKETLWSLSGNKVRSILTILGIVIGIASVITMIAIGQGAKDSIQSSIQSSGSNLITIGSGAQRVSMVSGGMGSAKSLTQEDADAIYEEVSGINAVASVISGRYQVVAKGNNTNTQILGTVAEYAKARNISIDEGIFISDQQSKTMEKVAVIGPSVKETLFGEDAANIVGQTIKIKGFNFKVIGVTTAKGGTGFDNSDDMIYIPLGTMQKLLAGTKYLSNIYISAQNESEMTYIQNEITSLLLYRHGISDETNADFSILNQSDLVDTASTTANTLTVLLASIAGISLLVGGIGIMNMMLTSVTERTREIGLRKAIGAKKKDIIAQFLAEAIFLTFIGGIIGILLGFAASLLVAKFSSYNTSVSIESIFLAFGVSAFVGIVFGYYPAKRASSLNPIEALRYE